MWVTKNPSKEAANMQGSGCRRVGVDRPGKLATSEASTSRLQEAEIGLHIPRVQSTLREIQKIKWKPREASVGGTVIIIKKITETAEASASRPQEAKSRSGVLQEPRARCCRCTGKQP